MGEERPCFCGLCDDQHDLTCGEFAQRIVVTACGIAGLIWLLF